MKVRQLAAGGTLYGLLLTALVVVAQGVGLLDNLERWFYDRRAAACQHFTPPPTDKLVHLDIDDTALDAIGAWPWRRADLAAMLDELRRAGPKAVAFDVLFSEPQPIEYQVAEGNKVETIDNDRLLAQALKRLGCAIVPMSLPITGQQPISPLRAAARAALSADPELTVEQLAERLKGSGPASVVELALRPGYAEDRRAALYRRVEQEMLAAPLTLDQMRERVLPQADADLRSPVSRLLEKQYARVTAELALRRFGIPVSSATPPAVVADESLPPITELAAAGQGSAFFDYSPERDGKVRSVPLFIDRGGRLIPHIGLSLAMMMLGCTPADVRLGKDAITLAPPGGAPIRLPVYTIYSDTLREQIPMMFDIPWIGGAEWQKMYDRVGGDHLTITVLWDLLQTSSKIQRNNSQAFEALQSLYSAVDPDKQSALQKNKPDLADPDALLPGINAALEDKNNQEFIDASRPDPTRPFKDAAERHAAEVIVASAEALQHVRTQNPQLRDQLALQRENLRRQVNGKAVLIGWVATASVADIVSTSIHPRVPGVVIHGTIFNAIMTGMSLHRLPTGANLAITIVMGLAATVVASRFSPERGLLFSFLLAGAYLLLNGVFLFDYSHLIVGVSGPLVVVASAWAACTLSRLLTERIARARILRRFRSYVDPALVDYLIEHPEVSLDGQVRELTVCFTDLEGFTALTERLGEKAVPLLNEFMGIAAPIIRRHGGLLNKFLGDGIMFFFGAPIPTPDHAKRAFHAVLELKHAMTDLNHSLQSRGFPHLSLRVGISTGHMVVGDTGGADRSDYTVLGDSVNLGARLESANKAIGSRNLVNDRALELAGDGFLVRPVGRICVMGKTEGVLTYEILAARGSAQEHQKLVAELTTAIVDAYLAGDIQGCLRCITEMETRLGPEKLTTLYRQECERLLADPPQPGFRYQIVLMEK